MGVCASRADDGFTRRASEDGGAARAIERATGGVDANESEVTVGTRARATRAEEMVVEEEARETVETVAIEVDDRVRAVEDVARGGAGGETARAEETEAVATEKDAEARAETDLAPAETTPVVALVDDVSMTARNSESDESAASRRHDEETLAELRRALSATLPKVSAPVKKTPVTAKKGGSKGNGEELSKFDSQSKTSVRRDESRSDGEREKVKIDLNDSDEELSEHTAAAAARMTLILREREDAAVLGTQLNRALPSLEEEPEVAEERLDVVTPSTSLRLSIPPRPKQVAAKEVSVEDAKKSRANRWTAPKKSAYDAKLDKLLAVAARAGSTAERMKDEMANLEQRVDSLKPVAVQPWQEHGSSWAGDRKSVRTEERSERSSSAGTILNPKNNHSREVRPKVQFVDNSSNQGDGKGDSTPSTPEKPKVVTSVLRSDLLKSMGEMSAEEKLERLGLKTVPEDEGLSHEANFASVGRSASVNRRVWHERASQSRSVQSEDGEYGMMGFSPPPPSVRSQQRDTGEESPLNYVDKLKAQAKLARAESAKTWKPGRGVKSGIA